MAGGSPPKTNESEDFFMIRIGWASCDISTEKPVLVLGQAHLRINKGVHDPITATALVLEDGGDCAVFVSLDMMSPGNFLLDMIREKVRAKNAEIPVQKIVINVTHTHDGGPHCPEKYCYGAGDDPADRMPVKVEVASSEEYLEFLSSSCADAVCRAWETRAEGGVAYGYGYAVVAHSRRVCYFDDISLRGTVDKTNTYAVNGHAAMYGNTNDAMFSHYEAGANPYLNLLFTFAPDGRLTGAVVNIPCPCQSSESIWGLSASFWNELRVSLRREYGDIFLLPQCAAGGDLSPRQLHYLAAENRRHALKYGTAPEDIPEMYRRLEIAERVTAGFGEVLSWARKDIRTDMPISHKVRMVPLSRRKITDDEYAAAVEGLAAARAAGFVETADPEADFVRNSRNVSDRSRFMDVIRRYNEQEAVPKLPMELHVVRVGDIAFATNPFELYMDFEHRIAARSPFTQTFIVQLCGGPRDAVKASYLCTERAEAGRGYSAIIYSCQISPEGGQELVEETLGDLKELYQG